MKVSKMNSERQVLSHCFVRLFSSPRPKGGGCPTRRERMKALRSENRRGKNWNERFARLLQQLHVLSMRLKGLTD
jgi:hypothetical protein